MNLLKYNRTILVSIFVISWSVLLSQSEVEQIQPITITDFSGTLSFLSSDWMEGREAGEKGSFIASDYIAAMMETNGIKPYGDHLTKLSTEMNRSSGSRSFFQTFNIIRYKTEKSTLSLISQTPSSRIAIQLSPSIDFEVEAGTQSIEAEAPLVFAGYGISAPELGFDDYQKLETKGCIVIVMKGFPGHHDSTSASYLKMTKSIEIDYLSSDAKLRAAMQHGAIALIEVTTYGSFEPCNHLPLNQSLLQSTMNTEKMVDIAYEDDNYGLPGDAENALIPFFRLGASATEELFDGTGINLIDTEAAVAETYHSHSAPIKNKKGGFSIAVKSESLIVRNVIGCITGKDTARSIVIGAHYDHLGMRKGEIYNGADDNASGCAGLLAMAKLWSDKTTQPPCNLIFAFWTSEEKGLLGSAYFVKHSNANPENTLMNINFDMISRSAPEDSTGLGLSIGTLKGSEALKNLAVHFNLKLAKPFTLDLWESSAEGGSDYASFAAEQIPVMTFFSGYQIDYHTTHDTSPKADLPKMMAILNLANQCLNGFLQKIPE